MLAKATGHFWESLGSDLWPSRTASLLRGTAWLPPPLPTCSDILWWVHAHCPAHCADTCFRGQCLGVQALGEQNWKGSHTEEEGVSPHCWPCRSQSSWMWSRDSQSSSWKAASTCAFSLGQVSRTFPGLRARATAISALLSFLSPQNALYLP